MSRLVRRECVPSTRRSSPARDLRAGGPQGFEKSTLTCAGDFVTLTVMWYAAPDLSTTLMSRDPIFT